MELGEPKIEEEKKEPKIHSVQFDNSHFGEIYSPIDTLGLVAEMNDWWQNISVENGYPNKDDKRWKNVDYYMMELGKDALEWGDGEREIKIILEGDRITVVVSDQGNGFENPNDDIESHPNHGLFVVKKFADEFIIETNGKKFTKVPKKRKLAMTEETDVKKGTRITFVKNLK